MKHRYSSAPTPLATSSFRLPLAFATAPPPTQIARAPRPPTARAALPAVRGLVAGGTAALTSRASGFVQPGLAGLALAVVLGAFLGRLTGQRSGAQRLSSVRARGDAPREAAATVGDDDEGATPAWLNYAFARMWALFQKNTRRLVSEVLQPVLDETERPAFVAAVRVSRFAPGKSAPYLRLLRRLPSRALAEVQYSVNALFSSTSVISSTRRSHPEEPGRRRAGVDLLFLSSLRALSHRRPVRAAGGAGGVVRHDDRRRRSHHGRPHPAQLLLSRHHPGGAEGVPPPEDRVPGLSSPRHRGKRRAAAARASVGPGAGGAPAAAARAVGPVRRAGPRRRRRSRAGRNRRRPAEVGLHRRRRHDADGSGRVDFAEFCDLWPALERGFVPNRYTGVLAVFLRQASGLPVPLFGPCDPTVTLTLGDQECVSKRDSRTSLDGAKGAPTWNEAFEFNCMDRDQELDIVVREGAAFGLRGRSTVIGRAAVPLSSLSQPRAVVNLEPQGKVRLDVLYADFVDNRS